MTIPHAWHQDFDVRRGQFRVVCNGVFCRSHVCDFRVLDDDTAIGDGFPTTRNEQVGDNAEFIGLVLGSGGELRHLAGKKVDISHVD